MSKPKDIDNDSIYKKKIRSFAEFALKVRIAAGLQTDIRLTGKYNQLKKIQVYVGKGNNRYLIVALLKRRFWL